MKIFKTIRIYTEYVANLIRKDWLAHAFLHFGLVVGLVIRLAITPTQAFILATVWGIFYEVVWDWWLCEDKVEWQDLIANAIGGSLAWLIFVI